MHLKSKYRQAFKDGGRVEDGLPIEPPVEAAATEPPAPVESAAPEPQPVETPAPEPQPPPPEKPQDDNTATVALRRQIEGLRQAEQLQRQQAAQAAMPAQPMSREQRLAAWQAEGISPAEVQFFQRNPEMIDFPQITGLAIHRAKEAGHERGTDAHFDFVKKAFDANLAHLQGQAKQPAMQPTMPTPKFFAPPPGRSPPNPSRLVSAPVSRDVPSGSGKRYGTPGKVTLTAQEVEAARVSGVSVEEYARQKIEYARQREAGEYRDARETQR